MTSNRYIENTFPDYVPGCDCLQGGKISTGFVKKAKVWIKQNIETLLVHIPHFCSEESDSSVYTGTTGVAFLLLRLMDTIYKEGELNEQLTKAINLVLESSKKAIRGKRISFLCGDAGPLALAAIIAHRRGDSRKVAACLDSLTSMLDRCCNDDNLPDEMLYGRSGYLHSLLLVRRCCGAASISDAVLEKVCHAILDSGYKLARSDRSRIPLKYIWHNKEYLGAAHGYFGIFFTILQPEVVRLPVIQSALSDIKESIDVLLSLRFPSGNFPSSYGNTSDRLVQWCHGSPGAVDALTRAYEVFEDSRYLEAAERCCDVIWQRGLLQKGYGTCHGTAGNGYSFLTMYQMKKNEKHLYRALKFGEWCLDCGKHGCRTPDRPFSLYEGLAGTVNFIVDLIQQEKPNFIGYHLP